MGTANRNISLRAVRIFCAAAERVSFREAAERLFLTSSAISHQVKQLETELGTRLFRRTARSLELTADGSALYEDLRPLLDGFDSAISRHAKTRKIDKASAACDAAIAVARKQQPESRNDGFGRRATERAYEADLALALSNRGVLLAAIGNEQLAKQDFLAAIELRTDLTPIFVNNLERMGRESTSQAGKTRQQRAALLPPFSGRRPAGRPGAPPGSGPSFFSHVRSRHVLPLSAIS